MATRDRGTTLPFRQAYKSVKDRPYNAVGDGLTNDAAAVQAALTANAGSVVIIPPGSYNMGSTALSVPAGTFVYAQNATLTWTSQVKAVTFAGSATLRQGWIGGKIVGPGGTTYGINGFGFYATGTDYAPAATPPDYILGPVIRDVEIRDWEFAGVWHEYTERADIQSNHIYNCGYVGIAGISSKWAKTEHNRVHDVDGIGAPDRYGIFYSAHESNETANPRTQKSSIAHNIVYNVPQWEGIDIHGDTDVIMQSNTIYNCRYCIMVTRGDTGMTSTRAPKRVTVTGNHCTGNSNGACITVTGANGYENATGIVISGNTLTNGGWDTSEGAIRVYNADDIVISNNIIKEPYIWGINLIEEIYRAEVCGNIIVDPQDSAYATPACIHVNANNVHAHIHGNTFAYSGNAALNTYVGVRSIYVLNGLTGLEVRIGANRFEGVDATHMSAVFGTVTGVNYDDMYSDNGTFTLAAGVATVSFTKRFPIAPRTVLVGLGSALNPVRAHTITTTQFQLAGTGVDTGFWRATT